MKPLVPLLRGLHEKQKFLFRLRNSVLDLIIGIFYGNNITLKR